MKNLKRALALLVVVTMMISTVAFASFSDVTGSSNVANAVNVGVGLNLFKGYEDGTFKPEGDITRAEFAAIVVRALGQEAQASGAATATSFTDVKADHWAAGYINIVTRLGVVNGYGDGTFGPEDKVTYEQAIKMIVVSLGYTPAIGSAGYPVGYLTKAGELGITSGVAGSNGVPANRGTVAQLIFNALDVPIMTQDGYGTDISFVINDGVATGSVRKTMMSEYLDVVKLQVTVDKNLATTSTTKNENDVEVTILNNYNTKYDEEFVEKSTVQSGFYALDAGTSGIGDLVGSKAFAYVAYDDSSSDTPVVVFAVKDTSKTDEVTIKSSDIENISTNGDIKTLEYWANETDKKTTKITYDLTDTLFYENGVATTTPTAPLSIYGSVTFSKVGDTVADYDRVFITNYENFVVDSVSERNFRVSSKNGASAIEFDPDDSSVLSTLVDSKGVAMKWTDLKEDDILSLKRSSAGKDVTVATLVTDKVTGKITEVDGEEEEYTIDGKVYEIDPDMSALKLEDEGTFYLDILGNICYADTTAALNTNYAYIFAVEPGTGIDPKTEVKLFTKKGEFVTLKTATKVKVDGFSNIPTESLKTLTKTTTVTYTAPVAPSVTPVAGTPVVTYGTTAVGVVTSANGLKNPVEYPYTIATTVDVKVAATQFITYDVNSSNEVTKIDRAANAIGSIDQDDFSLYSTKAKSYYSEGAKTLETDNSKVYVTDDTVIMVAYGTNEDNYEILNVAALADDQDFDVVSFYNVNADREVGAVLVKAPVTIEASTTGIAAITGISSGTNAEGDTIDKLKALQNGEAKVFVGADTLAIATGNETVTLTNPKVDNGYALIPVLNTKGEVKEVTVLAVPNTTTNEVAFTATDSTKVVYTYGKVINRNRMTLTLKDGPTEEDVVVPGTANVTIYDERLSESNRTAVGGVADFDADLNIDTNVTTYDNDVASVYAITREYDGKIVDVMIYIFK